VYAIPERAHLAWFIGDGAGARARLRAVLPHLAGVRVSLVSVGPAGEPPPGVDDVVELPWTGERPPALGRRTRPSPSRLRSWLAVDRPDLLVVDGGGEVAAAARTAGVPTVNVRRPGSASTSHASILAPTGAGELAPYPAALEPETTPRWLRERTVHAGLLSRYAGRIPHRRAGRRALGIGSDAQVVTVLSGRDGLGDGADLVAAAAATPTWTWLMVGRCGAPTSMLPANLHRLGWRADPWPTLEAADVVVGSGALSVVAEVASARRPLLVLPRSGRADDAAHGRLLAQVGAATVLTSWPRAEVWERTFARLLASDTAPLAQLDDGRGPARAADWLAAWAQSPPLGARAGRAAKPPTTPRASRPAGRFVDLARAPVASHARRR
jgi:UDP-N-acetylglucosamine--N-acetylmuramyl-(pentapeptide) pyrophosphoryl-undecaprenol N-acetylglucosamine transferase